MNIFKWLYYKFFMDENKAKSERDLALFFEINKKKIKHEEVPPPENEDE